MRDDRPLGRDTLASLIGHIVLDWNDLEVQVKALVYLLAVYHSEHFDSEEGFHVAFVMMGNSDLRSLIATAKALAFGVNDSKFYDKAEKVLNFIDNDLRNERNRCIHDLWNVGGNTTTRLKHGASVRKVPGSGERKLELQTIREYGSRRELEQLLLDIHEADDVIDSLNVRLNIITRDLERPEE
jgi:hypothetical protein